MKCPLVSVWVGGSRGPDSSSYLMPKTGTQTRLERRDRTRHDDPAAAPEADPAPAPAAVGGGAGRAGGGKEGGKESSAGKKGAMEGCEGLEMVSQLEMALCSAVRRRSPSLPSFPEPEGARVRV